MASPSPQPKAGLFHKYHPFQFVCPTLCSYWWVLFDHGHGLTSLSLSAFLRAIPPLKENKFGPKSRLTELRRRFASQDTRRYRPTNLLINNLFILLRNSSQPTWSVLPHFHCPHKTSLLQMKLLSGVLVGILTHLVTCFPGIECGLIFT